MVIRRILRRVKFARFQKPGKDYQQLNNFRPEKAFSERSDLLELITIKNAFTQSHVLEHFMFHNSSKFALNKEHFAG